MPSGVTNPGLNLAIPAFFGHMKPMLADLRRLGATDFSAQAPGTELKPGATMTIPLASVTAAGIFNSSTNNYLTGGGTKWMTATAQHIHQGYDISGLDIDRAADHGRIEERFSRRASAGVAMTISSQVAAAFDAVTASTAITLVASPTLAAYQKLFGEVCDLNKINPYMCTLALSGAELGKIKAAFHAVGISATTNRDLAQLLDFGDVVVLPGVAGRMWIVPPSSFGTIACPPTILDGYIATGIETDDDTGFSVAITVAFDQELNRRVTNVGVWFGCALISAAADGSTPGIIKVVAPA